jgi:hypothetical protein
MNRLFIAVLGAVLIAGCYPKGPTYIDELDLVATDYDNSFDFGSQATFHLFDTIVHIDDDNDDRISRAYDEEIIERFRSNMLSRGYEEVSFQEADVVMTLTAWEQTSVNYVYDWWGYWGWGWPGYGPGYGWGYPPGYGYVSTYSFGTLMMRLSYPDGSGTDNIPVVWTGLVNGLLEGSTSGLRNRIDRNIDQIFEQSPYIERN